MRLNDEMLDKLGKVFIYYFIDKTKATCEPDEVKEFEEPEITFEQFINIWQRGDDISEIISATQSRT